MIFSLLLLSKQPSRKTSARGFLDGACVRAEATRKSKKHKKEKITWRRKNQLSAVCPSVSSFFRAEKRALFVDSANPSASRVHAAGSRCIMGSFEMLNREKLERKIGGVSLPTRLAGSTCLPHRRPRSFIFSTCMALLMGKRHRGLSTCHHHYQPKQLIRNKNETDSALFVSFILALDK